MGTLRPYPRTGGVVTTREEPLFCKGWGKSGPTTPCDCDGCCQCPGHVIDCTCDVDWSCVYGDHTRICWTYDR